jgi:sec-independent protein translocase protein TatA
MIFGSACGRLLGKRVWFLVGTKQREWIAGSWWDFSETAKGFKSMNTLALVMPGPTEWVVILMIVLVLFGAKKLPELAKSLGQGMNEFRKARQEFDKELQVAAQDLKAEPKSVQSSPPVQPVQPEQPAPVKTGSV